MSDSTPTSTSPTTALVLHGDGPSSFDTLEQVIDTPDVEVKPDNTVEEEVNIEAAAPKEEQTTVKVPKDIDGNPVEPEVVAAAVDPEKEEVTEEQKTAAKSLKVKTLAGREVEIDPNTTVTKKIDGVDTQVSIKEVLDQYAGKVAYDKKFTELDTERKAYYHDKDQTTKELSSIMGHALEMRAGEAILEMARIAKLDPAPLYQAFQKEVIGELDKFMQMTQPERDAHLLRQENEFLRKSQKSIADEESKEQAQKALKAETSKLQETLKVKDESVVKAKETIEKNPDHYKQWLGGKDPSPKQLVELADAMERWDLATTALNMVDPQLAKDTAIMQLAVDKLQGNKHLPLDEIVKAASKLFGKPLPVKNTANKVITNITSKAKQAQMLSDDEARDPKIAKVEAPASLSWDDV